MPRLFRGTCGFHNIIFGSSGFVSKADAPSSLIRCAQQTPVVGVLLKRKTTVRVLNHLSNQLLKSSSQCSG